MQDVLGLETRWGHGLGSPVTEQSVAGILLTPSLVVHAHLGVQRPVATPVGATGRAFSFDAHSDLSWGDVRRRQGRSARLLSLRRTGLPQAVCPAHRDGDGDDGRPLHVLRPVLARARFRTSVSSPARIRASRAPVASEIGNAPTGSRWRMRAIFTSGAPCSTAISTRPRTPAIWRSISC